MAKYRIRKGEKYEFEDFLQYGYSLEKKTIFGWQTVRAMCFESDEDAIFAFNKSLSPKKEPVTIALLET